MFQDTPFNYIWYKDLNSTPDIPMSEDLRAEFTALADRIKAVKSEDEFPSIKETYDVLKKKLVAENRKMGKNVVYTKELKEFIYWSIYHLLDVPAKKKEKSINTDENTADDEKKKTRQREKVSQNTAGWIFGLYKENPKKPKYHFNKIEKYDLYPIRSYKAFNKHEYISMIPNKTDTLGIRIAKVLNRGVLAPHACRKTILVTNDLDVFANIESPDNKKYIMTAASDGKDAIDDIENIHIAYARYLFANGNNIFENTGRISPGKIKKHMIESLSNRKEYSFYTYDILPFLLAANKVYGMEKDDSGYDLANEVENLNIEIYNTWDSEGLKYDDLSTGTSIYYKAYLRKEFSEKTLILRERILHIVDEQKVLADDVLAIHYLVDSFRFNLLFNLETGETNKLTSTRKKDAILWYWLLKVLRPGEWSLEDALDWLKSDALSKYWDSIQQEVGRKDDGADYVGLEERLQNWLMKNPSDVIDQSDSKKHIMLIGSDCKPDAYLKDELMIKKKIEEELKEVEGEKDTKKKKKEKEKKEEIARLFLVYIDTEAVDFGVAYQQFFAARNDCIVLVRDKTGQAASLGFKKYTKKNYQKAVNCDEDLSWIDELDLYYRGGL